MTGSYALALVVIALASHRLQRIATKDTLSDPLRAWVWAKAYIEGAEWNEDGTPKIVVRSKDWRWAWFFIECPHCVGWWTSLATFAVWFFAPWSWLWHPMIAAVAVAGMQSFVSSRKDA